MKLHVVLYATAAALLAAHFLRVGNPAAVTLCLLAPVLFLYRRRWVLLLLQLMAYAGVALWLQIAAHLVHLRWQAGRPWLLAALIIGAVAALTLAAGLLLNSRAAASRYPRSADPARCDGRLIS